MQTGPVEENRKDENTSKRRALVLAMAPPGKVDDLSRTHAESVCVSLDDRGCTPPTGMVCNK